MSVIDWLMDSDPSIRWQVMRDLTDAPGDVVAAERSKVAREGWGAELLSRQTPDGRFGGDASIPKWTSSRGCFSLMPRGGRRALALAPSSAEARRATAKVADNVTWHWWEDRPFFHGEVEPCINGRV